MPVRGAPPLLPTEETALQPFSLLSFAFVYRTPSPLHFLFRPDFHPLFLHLPTLFFFSFFLFWLSCSACPFISFPFTASVNPFSWIVVILSQIFRLHLFQSLSAPPPGLARPAPSFLSSNRLPTPVSPLVDANYRRWIFSIVGFFFLIIFQLPSHPLLSSA